MKHAAMQAAPSDGADSSRAPILVVESNARLGRKLLERLRADRYRALLARTAGHARVLARAEPLRAIVLCALDSPRGTLDLLEEIRGSGLDSHRRSPWDECLPAIVLGPRAEQLDMLRAFELGADDFIGGKHSYLELRARLGALLRRSEGFPATRLLRIGRLEIDTGAHVVLVDGVAVELCRLEYELLLYLARNPSGVCAKRELLNAIWRDRAGAGARTVDSHASRLRRKLEAAGAPGLVVNVWGVGYRLT